MSGSSKSLPLSLSCCHASLLSSYFFLCLSRPCICNQTCLACLIWALLSVQPPLCCAPRLVVKNVHKDCVFAPILSVQLLKCLFWIQAVPGGVSQIGRLLETLRCSFLRIMPILLTVNKCHEKTPNQHASSSVACAARAWWTLLLCPDLGCVQKITRLRVYSYAGSSVRLCSAELSANMLTMTWLTHEFIMMDTLFWVDRTERLISSFRSWLNLSGREILWEKLAHNWFWSFYGICIVLYVCCITTAL